jgi:hypothetical protein
MDTITIKITVDKSRRVTIDIPDELPLGELELTLRPITNGEPSAPESGQPVTADTLTREEVRRRLKAAGLLSDETYAPPDAVELSDDDELELGRLMAQGTSILDIVNEDRGEY